MSERIRSHSFLPQIGAALVLLGALFPGFPYGYYIVLRWTVCIVFLVHAGIAFKQKKIAWAWGLASIALIFNPWEPIHLGRDLWLLVDLVALVTSLVALLCVQIERPEPINPSNGSGQSDGSNTRRNAEDEAKSSSTFAPLPPHRNPRFFYYSSTRRLREAREREGTAPQCEYTCHRCGHTYEPAPVPRTSDY